MTLKSGNRLGTIDAYGKIVLGENHHEFEVVSVKPAAKTDAGDLVVVLKKL